MAAQPQSLPSHPYQSLSLGVSVQRVVSVSGPAVPEDFGPSSVSIGIYKMSCVTRKPVFGISDQVRHKLGCIIIEDG